MPSRALASSEGLDRKCRLGAESAAEVHDVRRDVTAGQVDEVAPVAKSRSTATGTCSTATMT